MFAAPRRVEKTNERTVTVSLSEVRREVVGGSWVKAGAFGVFFFDDGKTAYAEIVKTSTLDTEYVECKVHMEGEPSGVFDVHKGRFVYALSRAQYTVAWYYGFPDHVRRLQAIVNYVKGGDA